MNAARFPDTNIPLHACDLVAPTRRKVTLGLVEQGWEQPGETALNVQILQELHVNLCKGGLSMQEASNVIRRSRSNASHRKLSGLVATPAHPAT